jgi:OOP family OmpA-OmpF porin
VIRAAPSGSTPVAGSSGPVLREPSPRSLGDFGARLEADGRVILSDLSFDTGSAQLGEGSYSSLRALAEYLEANQGRRVALVGHTDAEGSLDGNITLSRRRAGSVLERLVSDYGTRRAQLDAQGMGYLAPIATNLTAEGREANRRVEVIIVSTE